MSRVSIDSNIVSVEWLYNHLSVKNLLVLDATISKVIGDISAIQQFQISGTQFFDIKKQFSVIDAPFPNTIPSAEHFENAAQQLGVNQDSAIVIYDEHGIYSSARAWWLFKVFGFSNVAILNGGLPEWKVKGYPLEDKSNKKRVAKGDFKAKYSSDYVVYFESLEMISNNDNYRIIDARSSDRFNCIVAEPRVGIRSGTIPSSSNLPFNMVLEKGKLKSKEQLQILFKTLASENQHLVFTCGTGITATVLAIAATIAGFDNSVYDGSWTEYGTLTIA